MKHRQAYRVPPQLRGLARTICDADLHQFPELTPEPGHSVPTTESLRQTTTEVNDGVQLSPLSFKLFRAAYVECKQQLHSVAAGVMNSGTPVAEVLVVASRMDHLCTELQVPLLVLFPSLKRVHDYLLDLADHMSPEGGRRQHYDSLLVRLLRFLCVILEKGWKALQDYAVYIASCTDEPLISAVTPSSGNADVVPCVTANVNEGDADSEASKRCPPLPPKRCGEGLANTATSSTYHNAMRERKASSHDAASPLLVVPSVPYLPPTIVDAVSSVNGDLAVHFAHLQWYVEVMKQAPFFFNIHAYLEEHVLQVAWERYLGQNRPACTAEEFQQLLPIFPASTRVAVLSVVDFKGCGVVSLYSLQRLLLVWGPLQLLEVNLRCDLQRGVVNLSDPFHHLASTLAMRPDAQVGDYVVGLTDVPGELRVAVLRPIRGPRWTLMAPPIFSPTGDAALHRTNKTIAGGDFKSTQRRLPLLTTVTYILSCATGAWMMKGLTREEYDSVTDVCSAFSDIFIRPCGGSVPLQREEDGTGHGADMQSSASTPMSVSTGTLALRQTTGHPEDLCNVVADTESPLHRAAFRNNSRYVATLLSRGGGTVINCAVVDPLICSNFQWTPLLCAVNNPHSDPADVVRLLLEAGADVHYTDDSDCTALYYAIANGYVETVRALLHHCPTMQTSAYTLPLLVTLGAHHLHMRDTDVCRLVEVVPTADMLSVIAPRVAESSLLALATRIVEEKLHGQSIEAAPEERLMVAERCSAGPAGLQLYTPAEVSRLERRIRYHTQCCLRVKQEVQAAVRVLYACQYRLSWVYWLKESSGHHTGNRPEAAADEEGMM